MPLLSTINKLTRDFMSLYKVPGVMCQAVEGHCYQLMMGSHLHWGRGAGGEQGEPEGIHWSQSLLQLWKINNSHYVSVNASWRVSRGGAVPALPGWKAKKGGLMWWGRQTYIWAINCCRKCQKPCDSSPLIHKDHISRTTEDAPHCRVLNSCMLGFPYTYRPTVRLDV